MEQVTDDVIDDLLKEMDVRADEQQPQQQKDQQQQQKHQGRPNPKVSGISSVSFSTYNAPPKEKEEGDGDGDGKALQHERRQLPKSLNPIRKQGDQPHGEQDPWMVQREALPRLHGGGSDAPPAPGEHRRGSDSGSVSPARSRLPLASSPGKRSSATPQPSQNLTPSVTPKPDAYVRAAPVAGGVVPLKRYGHASAIIGGSLYVFGGMRAGQDGGWEHSSDMHEFGLETHVWTPCFVAKGEAPTARHGTAAAPVGDSSLVLFGGIGAGGVLHNDLHEYNTDTQEWTLLAPGGPEAPTPRGEASLVQTGNGRRLLLFGGRVMKDSKEKEDKKQGRRKLGYTNDLWSFDTKHRKWRHMKPEKGEPPGAAEQPTVPCVPKRRAGHAACRHQNVMYVTGGGDSDDVFADVWAYSIDSNAWREVAIPGTLPRAGHLLFPFGDVVFCHGGFSHLKNRSPAAEKHCLQWFRPAGPTQWGTTHLQTAASSPPVSSYMMGGARNGVLHYFGGRIGFGSSIEASNNVYSALVTNDIIVDQVPQGVLMAKVLRKAQQAPKDWAADLQITVGGRSKYAHLCVLEERAPDLVEAISPFMERKAGEAGGARQCILDGNKRRKGLPCLGSSDVIYNLLHFAYTGRLAEHDDLDKLNEVAAELKLADVADHVAEVQPPKQPGRVVRKGDTAAERLAAADAAAEVALHTDLTRMRLVPARCDVMLASDASSSRQLTAHVPVLFASSAPLRKAISNCRITGDPYTSSRIKVEEEQGIFKVTLKDLPTTGIDAAISFMYTGTCQVDLTTAAGIMATANVLKLPVLRALCEKEIWRLMADEDGESICELLGVADRYKAHQLKDKVLAVLSAHPAASITSLAAYQTLSDGLKKELLQACEDSGMRVHKVQRNSYQARADSGFSGI